jgi:hypothetical protein
MVVFSFLGLVIVGGSSFFLVFERIAMARHSQCQTTNAKKTDGLSETGPAPYEALIYGNFPNAFSRSRAATQGHSDRRLRPTRPHYKSLMRSPSAGNPTADNLYSSI